MDEFKGTELEGIIPEKIVLPEKEWDEFQALLESDNDLPKLRELFSRAPRFGRGE